MCVCACVCVRVCVCMCAQINHEPSSSWSVISTGGAARATPRVFQGPPPFQSSLLCRHSPPPRRPRVLRCLSLAVSLRCSSSVRVPILALVLEVGRKRRREGREKAGREGGREDIP